MHPILDWQCKVKAPGLQKSDLKSQDVTLDSFKGFMESHMHGAYCSHYEGPNLQKMFKDRASFIKETEIKIAEKLARIE